MSDADEAEQAAICVAVGRYLQAHPHACDTARGIAAWWLGAAGMQVTLHNVEQALERMVAAGTLRRQVLAGGVTLYRVAAEVDSPAARSGT